VATHPKSGSESVQSSFEIVSIVDEEGCLLDVLFPFQLAKKQHGWLGSSRRKQSGVKNFVRFGIDSCEQPAALVVDLNHGLVNCNVIQRQIDCWLEIRFLDPIVDGGATALDPPSQAAGYSRVIDLPGAIEYPLQ